MCDAMHRSFISYFNDNLIDKMREMGDDLSDEDKLEKDYMEKEHNKLVEGKVIIKIKEIMDGMK